MNTSSPPGIDDPAARPAGADAAAAGTSASAGQAGTAATPGDPRPGRRRPRRRVLLLGALVIVAVLAVVLTTRDRGGLLDPESVSPEGSRAVVQILGDQGVTVTPASTLAQARAAVTAAGAGAGTGTEMGTGTGATVLVTDSLLPDQAMIEQLLAARPQRIVLVRPFPGDAAFDRLAAGVTIADVLTGEPVAPGCDLRAATQAGAATLPGLTYDVTAWGSHAEGCYTSVKSAAVALLEAGAGRPEVVLLGSPHPLTNAGLDEQGNAALALNLLGATEHLVWWTPTPLDPALADAAPSLTDLLPGWVRPAAIQLLVACLVVALWRGRRLGRLVVEALPVVVPAGETTAGRARLLAAQRARGEAAEQLRAHARERIRRRLGLPPRCSADRLVGEVAFRTRRPPRDVGGLLYGHEPLDDAALVRLDHDLAALTSQVGALEGTR